MVYCQHERKDQCWMYSHTFVCLSLLILIQIKLNFTKDKETSNSKLSKHEKFSKNYVYIEPEAAEELLKKGKSIIVISSELPEVLGLSDRVIVMREGKKVKEFENHNLTEEDVLQYAMGVNKDVKN